MVLALDQSACGSASETGVGGVVFDKRPLSCALKTLRCERVGVRTLQQGCADLPAARSRGEGHQAHVLYVVALGLAASFGYTRIFGKMQKNVGRV